MKSLEDMVTHISVKVKLPHDLYLTPIIIDDKRYYYRDEDKGKYILTDDERIMYIFDCQQLCSNNG